MSFTARLPASLALRVSRIDATQGLLVGEELALVEGVNLTRRRELVAGRVLARELISAIGYVPSPITQLNGAPLWPIGLCGSISHSARHIAVAVAPIVDCSSVGIDIEDGRSLGVATRDVGTSGEVELFRTHQLACDGEVAARMIFSAKEALFKCQAPMTGNVDLDFMDVRLDLAADGIIWACPAAHLEEKTFAIIRRVQLLFQSFQGVTLAIAWIIAPQIDSV